jgi:hypothetical protein
MRRVIATILLSLMLLQAIPVLHFFSSQKEIFYTYVDEEKPEQKLKLEKEVKEFLVFSAKSFVLDESIRKYGRFIEHRPSSPLLEYATPPPDAC